MHSTHFLKRLSLVLAFSFVGIIASFYFLKPNELSQSNSKKPEIVATVIKKINEIEKQSPNQIFWEKIMEGENLYRGDKIKTFSGSNAVVKFIKNSTTLNIEPNSTVVIDQLPDKLAIKVIAGNLFIKQEKNDQKIEITNSIDNKKIELKNAQASFNIGKNGSNIDLINGLMSSDGKSINSAANIFGELHPNYGESIYFDDNQNKIITFFCNNNLKDFELNIESGKDRDNLTSDSNFSKSENNIFELHPSQPGSLYWRIVAINKKSSQKFYSSIMKVNLDRIIPPLLIYPSNQETLNYIPEENSRFEFKWNLALPLKNIHIEISNENKFNKIIFSEPVTKQTYFETNKLTNEGQYFWRIVGDLPEQHITVTSKEFKFFIVRGKSLNSPNILSPENNAIFRFIPSNVDQSILLSWKNEIEAKEYLLTFKNKNIKKEDRVKNNFFKLKINEPGTITWSVQSIGESGNKSKINEQRDIKILPMKNFSFISTPELNTFFVSTLPTSNFTWEKQAEANLYKFNITENLNNNNIEKIDSKNEIIKYNFKKPGTYYYYVEAYDQDNLLIGKTKVIQTNVKELPLPEAPLYESSVSIFQSSDNGDVNIKFKKVNEKFKILTELRNASDILIEKQTLINSLAKFKSLLPGKYAINARTVDEYGRMSEYAPPHFIQVPEKSNIKAPSIKNLKIK